MARPKKINKYCSTVQDILREDQTKEANRRASIARSMASLRADEKAHQEASKLKSGDFELDRLVNELEALVLKHMDTGGSKSH